MTELPDTRPAVLIVESEALIAMLISDLLAEAGHRTIWVADAASARAAVSDGGLALRAAVVDLRLNDGSDGRDILRHLRERQPGMPALVVTGFDGRAPQAQLRGVGGPTARISLPLDCEELAERFAEVLERPATGNTTECRRGARRAAA